MDNLAQTLGFTVSDRPTHPIPFHTISHPFHPFIILYKVAIVQMIHILWGLVGAQDAEYPRDGVLHLLLPGYHFWTAFFLQGLRALHSGRMFKGENTTKRTHLDKLP